MSKRRASFLLMTAFGRSRVGNDVVGGRRVDGGVAASDGGGSIGDLVCGHHRR